MPQVVTDTPCSTPPPQSTAGTIAGFFFFLAICIVAMIAGAVVTTPNVTTWYKELARPPWTPPPWLFGPVGTVLYIMMAVSAWLVWMRREVVNIRWPMTLFGAQLVLNVAWSWIFFGMKSPGVALIEIVALLVAIALTMVSFAKTSGTASLLLAPYLAWVMFATSLNIGFWWLN
jgi:tryptophan-rich sensory protein